MSILPHPNLPAITLHRGGGQGAAPHCSRHFHSSLSIVERYARSYQVRSLRSSADPKDPEISIPHH
jgi:hypothetical protein